MSDGLNLGHLSDEKLEQLRQATRLAKRSAEEDHPQDFFPWHDTQEFLRDGWADVLPMDMIRGVRVIEGLGGNRSGKSAVGKGTLADILDRKSPLNSQLVKQGSDGKPVPMTPYDPLNIWIVPPTGEKFRQDWVAPADGRGIRWWMGDRFYKEVQAPDHIFYGLIEAPPGTPDEETLDGEGKWLDPLDPHDGRIDPAKVDKIIGKSQDQRLHTFEASTLHFAFIDEEPQDPQKVTSIRFRLGTTNGAMIFTFTPLNGLSWSYRRWYKPLVEQGRAVEVGERRWVHLNENSGTAHIICQMSMEENPMAREFSREIREDPELTEAEKAARVDGKYGYVKGALIKNLAGMDLEAPTGDHQVYVVDRLPGRPYRDDDGNRKVADGRIVQWYMVADPNKSYGATLACTDQDGNVYFVGEHLEEGWPTRKHARAMERLEKKFGATNTLRYADPGSAGAQSRIDLNDYGLPFMRVSKGKGSLGRSIKKLRSLAHVDPAHHHPFTGERGAPRVYFYRPGLLTEWSEGGVKVRGSRLVEQISQARQTDNEDAPPDTPHKSVRSKLDLFDCARYTAMIVQKNPGEEVRSKRRKNKDENRVHAKSLSGEDEDDKMHPLDQDMYAPTYHLGGGY
jgi:phage terminase large subunit-like protein